LSSQRERGGTFVAEDSGEFAGKFAEFLDANVSVTYPCCVDFDEDILILEF
jgi:hypothetical protein